jgi:quercetin dioxygenase-like cupin family protein
MDSLMEQHLNNSPQIKYGLVSNLWTRQMHFVKAGNTEYGHTHDFDHLTLLASGSVRITVDGEVSTFVAPHMIFISKDKRHEIVALEDNTVAYCIHAHRDLDTGDILDPSMVPNGVNMP